MKSLKTLTLALVILTSIVSCENRKDSSDNNPYYGVIHEKYLEKDEVINGYPCKAGRIGFYDNDSLMSFVLSKDCKINNDIIPAGSRITMYWNGKPEFIYLSKATKIQGFSPRIKRFAHWHVSFYNNGNLSLFGLQDDTEINGIPCSKNEELRLYPNGSLWECSLSKDFKINGKLYNQGTHIIFDESGKAYKHTQELYWEFHKRLNIEEYLKRYCCKKQ